MPHHAGFVWLVFPIVQTIIGRTVAAGLTALAVAATLNGCAWNRGLSDGTPPGGSGGVVNLAPVPGSALASALSLVPDMPNATVMFTDWSMLGHHGGTNPDTFPLASQLLYEDDQLQKDVGIRSTSADWEIDMWQPRHSPTIVLHFNQHTELAGLTGRLTRFGYHANGSIFTGPFDKQRLWTYGLHNIGIAADGQLFVGGPDATMVRSVLAASGDPLGSLGHAASVTPLLAMAALKVGHVATASVVVGSGACVTLEELLRGRGSPMMLANLRKQFKGTFTHPQAEITAIGDPAGTTALDAQTFPDQAAARANQAGRSAAVKVFNLGDPNEIRVAGSSVTGRVLSFTLTAGKPHGIEHRVLYNTLGVDVCM